MSVKDSVTDIGGKVMSRTHKLLLKVSGGKVLDRAFGMQVVELHTIGRKSGQRRSTMLTTPIHDDDRVVLIASKDGDNRHPDWYRNLSANPDVEITLGGTTRTMTARTASEEERAELWPEVIAAYKGYAGYQKRTDRVIPVVICEPRQS